MTPEELEDLCSLEMQVRKAGCVLLVGLSGTGLYVWPKPRMPKDLANQCTQHAPKLIKLLRTRAVCSDIPLPR